MSIASNSIKRGLLEAIKHAEGWAHTDPCAQHGPALVLLHDIAHNPSAVIEALAA